MIIFSVDKDILFINCSLINLGIIQCSVAMVNFTFSFRTIILRIVANLMTLTFEHDPRFRRVPINNFQMLCDHDKNTTFTFPNTIVAL